MKVVEVVTGFVDLRENKRRSPGERFTVEESRAAELIERGLVRPVRDKMVRTSPRRKAPDAK